MSVQDMENLEAVAIDLITGRLGKQEFEQFVTHHWRQGTFVQPLAVDMATVINRAGKMNPDANYGKDCRKGDFGSQFILGERGKPGGINIIAPPEKQTGSVRTFEKLNRRPHFHGTARIAIVTAEHAIFYADRKIDGEQYVVRAPVQRNDIILWPSHTCHTFDADDGFQVFSAMSDYLEADVPGFAVDAQAVKGLDFDRLPMINYCDMQHAEQVLAAQYNTGALMVQGR